ncbi:unnamed protein product [Pleuronectes platessa]|uniref:Uncharacterized protein n=1 Tax=Pleuronectes platessa TaxID=8262 RepID=A0A9N7Z4Y7_PLEPL|nr:unnamed protein product [Pleuronectes platessa]
MSGDLPRPAQCESSDGSVVEGELLCFLSSVAFIPILPSSCFALISSSLRLTTSSSSSSTSSSSLVLRKARPHASQREVRTERERAKWGEGGKRMEEEDEEEESEWEDAE